MANLADFAASELRARAGTESERRPTRRTNVIANEYEPETKFEAAGLVDPDIEMHAISGITLKDHAQGYWRRDRDAASCAPSHQLYRPPDAAAGFVATLHAALPLEKRYGVATDFRKRLSKTVKNCGCTRKRETDRYPIIALECGPCSSTFASEWATQIAANHAHPEAEPDAPCPTDRSPAGLNVVGVHFHPAFGSSNSAVEM